MSLIEKAAGRLAQTPNPASRAAASQSVSEPEVRMERAVTKLPPGQAENTAAAPAVSQRLSTPPVVDFEKARREPTLSQPAFQGTINLARLKQAGMITPDGERTQIAEEFRHIKRPLLMNAFNQGAVTVKNANLIMVTSSLPGEGKSFCSINLAMSIAMEMDHTVLLVDSDVAKPSIPQFLGLKSDKGLMDLLQDDKLQLSDVLIKTNVEKLTILPAGHGHRYSTELLASIAMRRLIDDMRQRYSDRIIIFDSPPLLMTTEARVLASHMGQIVVVVEAGKATHEALRESLKHIEHCEVIGLVLNKGSSLSGTDYYGSYYGAYGK